MARVATAVSAPSGRRQRVDRCFYISVAMLTILLNIAAFAPSIVEPSGRRVPLPLTPLVTVHAIVASAWLLLFLMPAPAVVRALSPSGCLLLFLRRAPLGGTGRTSVHRRVGVGGMVLAAAFIIVGCL